MCKLFLGFHIYKLTAGPLNGAPMLIPYIDISVSVCQEEVTSAGAWESVKARYLDSVLISDPACGLVASRVVHDAL
jgi:hypothetical protein